MADDNIIDFTAIPPAAGFEKLEALQVEVARLAALPELVYAQVRKDEAKRLGISPISVLDKAVKQARPKDDDTRAGSAVVLPEVEPWPDPVDGAELLDEILAQLRRFVVADEHQLIAVALWIVHTHCFEAWWISPKLLVESATKRCGKTRLFEVLDRLVRRKLLVSAATSSSVFRVIEASRDAPPTLLMDEADYLTEKDDNMRKLINAAQQKAEARVLISVPCGDGWESRLFSTWAPIALAGLGAQAVTIRDRSIVITMRRKTRDQPVEKLRGNKDYGFHELARKCARWAADHVEELKDAEPHMPAMLHDRAQDNWEPLVAIADAAGGDWPQRAGKAAARVLQAADELDAPEVGVQLIHDIMDVIDGGFSEAEDWPQSWIEAGSLERVPIGYLLLRLHDMGERIWSTYGKGGAKLRDYDLAELLRPFGVHSKQLKFNIGGEELNRRGFERRQFAHLLLQYPRQPATPLPSAETLENSVTEPATIRGEVAGSVTLKPAENLDGSGVAGSEGVYGSGVALARPKRLCTGCGEPLPTLAPASRVYCSDRCRARHHRSTGNINGPDPGTVASVPFMITARMKADLKARGFSAAQIKTMTPEQAHKHLAGAAAPALERCAHCGRECERGDMWPLDTGGNVHPRCADAYIGARDADPKVARVPFLITHAMKAKLRERGVHPDVIRELRPVDAHRLLDDHVPLNATRSPQQDLSDLAATLARAQDSASLAHEAMRFAAAGIEITPETVDAIRAGGAVAYAVRDALWIALS